MIGAKHFYVGHFKEIDKHKISQIIFHKNFLGYIVSRTLKSKCNQQFCGLIEQTNMLEENRQKFWKIERVEDELCPIRAEEHLCENKFLETHRHESTGRFVVTMSPKEDPIVLGDLKVITEKRLQQLWNRFEKNLLMLELYCIF